MAMKRRSIVFKLDEGMVDAMFFCGDRVDARHLAEGNTTVTATVTRMGTWRHRVYGKFSITRNMLNEMVANFDGRTYGQDIFLDKDHNPSDGAAAVFKKLFVEGNKLRAELSFTPFGVELATKKGYRYLSAEFTEDYEDPETEDSKGALLFGAAFTIRPFVKNLDPVQLTEMSDSSRVIVLDRKVLRLLTEETQVMKKKYLAILVAALKALTLAEPVQKQLAGVYETQADALGDDEKLHKALTDQITETGKKLAEQIGDKVVEIKIDLPKPAAGDAPKTLTEDQINDIVAKKLADAQQQAEADAKKLAETKDAKVKLLTDTINAAKGLSDAVKGEMVKELSEFIDADMPDDKITKLAELQITKANKLAADAQLMALGYQVPGHAGTAHISVDDSNQIKQLQETVDKRLGLTDLSDARRYARTGGQLHEDNKKFAEKVLALYDSEHAAQLHHEAKMLAGGDGIVTDVAVPASWERTVIREALYGLTGLQLVNMDTAAFNTSMVIPYSYRDSTAAGKSNTRVYEGGSIPRAGVIETSETAYPIPQKLSFEVSDELRYLTAAGHINYDSLSENQRNASRIISEDIEQLIYNEILHAADEYGATAVTDEDLETQADDSKTIFVLANWPVVHPRSRYDLQGNLIGSVTNPITVTYDSVARSEYDGSGTQSAGIYYVLDYNLGEIYLVNQAGAVQTPANGTAYTISYSYTPNVAKFNTDVGSTDTDLHWNGYLYQFGLRKNEIEDIRYHMADIALMSGTHKTQVEQAKQFSANYVKPGTDLAMNGNLGRIKDVPTFKTTAPGLWMGDVRAVIGERGNTRFRMMKPWTMGDLESQKDSNGRFVGKKEAYGDQFVVIHTPTQLKRANTSLVIYSATARVAR